MSKEKLTVKKVVYDIYNIKGDYLNKAQDKLRDLLKQIQEEVLKREDSFTGDNDDYYFEYVSLESIKEVFSKYLNENNEE